MSFAPRAARRNPDFVFCSTAQHAASVTHSPFADVPLWAWFSSEIPRRPGGFRFSARDDRTADHRIAKLPQMVRLPQVARKTPKPTAMGRAKRVMQPPNKCRRPTPRSIPLAGGCPAINPPAATGTARGCRPREREGELPQPTDGVFGWGALSRLISRRVDSHPAFSPPLCIGEDLMFRYPLRHRRPRAACKDSPSASRSRTLGAGPE